MVAGGSAFGRADGFLLVRVVDGASGAPVANAQVTDLDAFMQRLTDDRGEVRFDRGERRAMRLRVRQLGYRFVERVVTLSAGLADTTLVPLDRLPLVLPEQRTTAVNRCDMPVDPATQELSLAALARLRLAAEQYGQFRRSFPFEVRSERRTVFFDAQGGVTGKPKIANERTRSERWGDPYRPGEVLHRGMGFSVSLLFVQALADTVFWDRHCLVAREVEGRAAQRWVRLDFAPARDVDTPDWSGSAWLDSATSVLRRLEFRLTRLRDGDAPRRLEGYTTFTEPTPFITLPESTLAYWWRRGPRADDEWGFPDVLQIIHVTSVDYRGARPPRP